MSLLTEHDFLVTGHPRCGTGFMSKLFESYGYDVGHERMGRHGTSSWLFAVHTAYVPSSYDKSVNMGRSWKHIIHVVREPVAAISSIAFTESLSYPWRRKYVWIRADADPITQAVQSFVGWNKLVKAMGPSVVIRLEEAPTRLKGYLAANGYDTPADPKLPPRDVNARPHPKLTLGQIKQIVMKGDFEELAEWAKEYGYPLE